MNESFSENNVQSQSMQNQFMQNQPMQNQPMQRNFNRNYFQQTNQNPMDCQRPIDCSKPDDCRRPTDCSKSDDCRPTDCSKPDDCRRPADCSKPDDCRRPAECSPLDDCRRPADCSKPDDCQPPCPTYTDCGCMAYQAAMPYPLIKPACQNPRYAAAMLDNMGGQSSEMTAFSFYFYNHMTASLWKEVAETFHRIGEVEMHHMEIFGKLAMELGENPRLWSRNARGGKYSYWSPSYIPYGPFPVGLSIKNVLSQAIKGEQDTVSKYMQQTTWIADTNVCDHLLRIAADEQVHIEILTRLYHKF